MATVTALKDAVRLCGAARITPFIWGYHGLGKSSLVKQLAAEQGWGCVDMRCSQIEASDLRGLPDRVNGRTTYLPPADMPIGDLDGEQIMGELLRPFADVLGGDGLSLQEQHDHLMKLFHSDMDIERRYMEHLKKTQPRFRRGILFVDELNRAADDVQQAAFQLVLDREIGQYVLPPGWMVVAAGNYSEGYQTSGFLDPAFLDRFCHLDYPRGEMSMEDWINYMSATHGADAANVVEFAAGNPEHLDGKISGERGFNVMPSRRSWDAVARVENCVRKAGYSDDSFLLVLMGMIGMELGNQYHRYSCPVKPREVMKHGVRPFLKELQNLNRGQLTGLMWAISMLAKPDVAKDSVATICLDFAEWVAKHQPDKDIVVAFCRSLVTNGQVDSQDKARAAIVSNPRLANMVGRFTQKTNSEESFIDKMNKRPALQQLISHVAWGGSANDED